MVQNKFNSLDNLEIYILARQLSRIAWNIYIKLHWQDKKTMGDQFLEAVDSIGANIAEGYGRYHYLDRIKFFYNCRGSFFESIYHWFQILEERRKVDKEDILNFKNIADNFLPKLNGFIRSTYKQKNNQ